MSAPKPMIGQKYEIQPGDTITEIAFQAYGDARRYLEIAEHNSAVPEFRPARLTPGLIIEIPQPDYLPLPRGIGGMRGTVGKVFKAERGDVPGPGAALPPTSKDE
jgi:hypothetical protein